MSAYVWHFLSYKQIILIKGDKIKLNIKLNIQNIFNNDSNNLEKLIEMFNIKLLNIIIHLENQDGEN